MRCDDIMTMLFTESIVFDSMRFDLFIMFCKWCSIIRWYSMLQFVYRIAVFQNRFGRNQQWESVSAISINANRIKVVKPLCATSCVNACSIPMMNLNEGSNAFLQIYYYLLDIFLDVLGRMALCDFCHIIFHSIRFLFDTLLFVKLSAIATSQDVAWWKNIDLVDKREFWSKSFCMHFKNS